jgi:large subunit ribosomal protein L31
MLAGAGTLPYKPRLARARRKWAPNWNKKVCVMKKGIHPDYHFVEVQLNDGTTYKTRTTYGTAGQKITLDIDPSTHPAWTGGQQQLMDRGGRLTRFNKKFAGFVKP